MTTTRDHLHHLYAETDDPWDFGSSPYEQEKFAATRKALPRTNYRNAIELGCGNGALARHLAPHCRHYLGIDAVEKAVIAARKAVPTASFSVGYYPCRLPDVTFDLVILSEFLYFLKPADIRQLGRDLCECAPGADVICVTWLGDTGHDLQGVETLTILRRTSAVQFEPRPVANTGQYRIDRGVVRGDL